MKIFHFIPCFELYSGYEEDLTVRDLASLGHDVWVITSNISIKKSYAHFLSRFTTPGLFKYINSRLNIARLPSFPLPFDLTPIPFSFLLLIAIRPNCVHFHGSHFYQYLLPSLICRLLGIPYVVDIHEFKYSSHQAFYAGSNIIRNLFKFEYLSFRRACSKFLLFYSSHVISYEQICYDYLKSFYNFNGEVQKLSIGFDSNFFFPEPLVESIFSLEKKSNFTIGFVGNMSSRKSPFLYCELLRELPETFKLNFIGKWPVTLKSRFSLRAHELGVSDRVNFTGSVPYHLLRDEILKCDVFVYLTSSSISCLQILACHRPLVIQQDQKFSSTAHLHGKTLVSSVANHSSLIKEAAKVVHALSKTLLNKQPLDSSVASRILGLSHLNTTKNIYSLYSSSIHNLP